MKKLSLTRNQIIIECLLLLLLGLSFCLFLALVSYDPTDTSWSQTSSNSIIHNICGYTGAYVADICLQFLGFIAFSLPIFGIIASVKKMIEVYRFEFKPINYFKVSFRIIGFLAFIFSATAFFSINIIGSDAYQAGGNIGDIIAQTLLSTADHVSTSFLLLVIGFACITLITDLSWLYLLEKLGGLVIVLVSLLIQFLSRFVLNQSGRKKIKRDTTSERKFDIPLYTKPISSSDDDVQLDMESDFIIENPKHREIEKEIKEEASEEEKVNNFTEQQSSGLLTPIFDPLVDDQIVDNQIADDRITRLEESQNNNENSESNENSENNENNEQIAKDYTVREYVLADLTLSDPIIPVENERYSIIDENAHSIEIDANNEGASINIAADDESMYKNNSYEDSLNQIRPYENNNVDNNNTDNNNTDNNSDDDNEQDSLIHPLLRRNDKPLSKPTTPLPSLDLLTAPPTKQIDVDHDALSKMSELIEQSLADYRVKTKVVDYQPGPVITRFEIELAPGIKAARISTLDRDLARSLSMPSVRVVEVIPGKPYVGIELPNENRQTVYFREVLDSSQFRESFSPLTIVLGKDISDQSVVADLAKMPHVLVAGTTGSGKSVGVNAMILSILYKSQPEDVRFIMIDPKMLELSIYEGIPHLLTPVVTDMKDAANALNWCVNEMERRYRLMSALGVRNIAGYNEKIKQAAEMGRPIPDPLWKPTDSMDLDMPSLEKLPYIVVLVDEFADLIMAVGKKVEELIARLAQKARAAGIHLVLATQRPSVDVITGLIKANIPTRIAFTVSSKIDSRTILDQMGAESLLGMGDMLYLAPNSSIPVRVHGAFVRDEEVHAVVQDWKARGGTPKYIDNITAAMDDAESSSDDNLDEELDPLFDQVVAFVIETQRASISSVQRKFRIGYNRAARIVEQMENEGIVSSPSHNGNREVLAR